MKDRINMKILQIERYLDELKYLVPDNLEDYKTDIKTKLACERNFERIIESVIDLTFLIINEKI